MADPIAVASAVYNLAGDEDGRPDFLKTVVYAGIAQDKNSVGRCLVDSYRNSAAARLRRYLHWAKNDVDFRTFLGLTEGTVDGAPFGIFYPPIPFRYENAAVAEDSPSAALRLMHPICKRAFKRAVGGSFDQVQDTILDNEDIDKIDYVYAVFGVAFNVKDQASRKYVYKFMQQLAALSPVVSPADEETWLQNHHNDGVPLPWQHLDLESEHAGVSNYRTQIWWAFAREETGAGLLKPDARRDELWFEVWPDPIPGVPSGPPEGYNQRVTLSWQETPTAWRRLTFTGLQHRNYVYGTNTVLITAKMALETPEEDGESPFVVPLHEQTFDALSHVDSMQVGTACSFLVFNCFEIYKKKWYETTWFKIILIGAIIVISVVGAIVTGGTSLGVGGAFIASLLTGAGMSLTAALIIAAAVEVLAGILLAMLITEISTQLFGEKWGALIGAIIGTLLTLGLSAGNISEALKVLSTPQGWMALATATGAGASAYLAGAAKDLANQTAELMEEYSEKNAEIQRLYDETFGKGGEIDLSLVNKYISEVTEKPVDFLRRTLMTGSDIVEVTLGQIGSFTDNNLRMAIP